MPISRGFNAQPGRHGRSPDTENPAQWAARVTEENRDKGRNPSEEYRQFLELLATTPTDRPVDRARLVEMRRALPPPDKTTRASLSDRFLIPPFSVLDARQGYWQRRKRMWVELGIQSELGRGENLQPPSAEDLGQGLNGYRAAKNGLLGISEEERSHYKANATPGGSLLGATSLRDGRTQRGDGRGRPLAATFGSGRPGDLAAGFKQRGAHPIPGGGTGKNSAYLFKTSEGYRSLKDIQAGETASLEGGLTYGTTIHHTDGSLSQVQSGTSIFDPVLCELAYRWFCPQAGSVLDPFAGGSVRGVVAAKLGRSYSGIDLRPEQAEANYVQMESLCPEGDINWAVGDAANVQELLPGEYDFVFSCPPYADLERYSDDPRDLSTMEYDSFLRKYRHIVAATCSMLREDRFACFVVGDVRNQETGNYRNFVGDTVAAFRDAGLELYNEAVLVTAVGSLPIRVGRQFASYRKLGKTHQNVLVFVKGDAGRAAAACGEVDLNDLEMPECRPGAVAVCAQDCADLASQGFVDGDGSEVSVIGLPGVEACLLADVLRGEARALGKPALRTWVGMEGGWRSVQGDEELTYVVGDAPYLNCSMFPSATGPTSAPLAARRLQ